MTLSTLIDDNFIPCGMFEQGLYFSLSMSKCMFINSDIAFILLGTFELQPLYINYNNK